MDVMNRPDNMERITTEAQAKAFIEEHRDDRGYFDFYYEAWPVKDYCIDLEKDYDFDDIWTLGDDYQRRELDIERKHFTKGILTMTGTVYWVEEGTDQYNTVNKDFHVVRNGPAKELVCSETFAGVEQLIPICRRKHEARWDYFNEKGYYEDINIYGRAVDQRTKEEYLKKRILELEQLVIEE